MSRPPLFREISFFFHIFSLCFRSLKRRAFLSLVLLGMFGCAVSTSREHFAVQAAAPAPFVPDPQIKHDQPGDAYVDISVLTYNVKGLPWPLRMDLTEPDPDVAMAQIGAHLASLRARGLVPDVVLIQEGFLPTAAVIGKAGGYAFTARGPSRSDAALTPVTADDAALAADAVWMRGEAGNPILDSGLHAFSNYPIKVIARKAFGQNACAGYDCLAAKGVLAFAVAVPGVPDPVTFVTLHMNANSASGAPENRTLAAYRMQMDRFARVLESLDPLTPLIFGGDFNIKTVRPRQQYADQRLGSAGLTAVHVRCAAPDAACDARYPAANAHHWLEPREVQGYRGGRRVHVQPIASDEMFADQGSGGRMSDHIGYLARYRLSWSTSQ